MEELIDNIMHVDMNSIREVKETNHCVKKKKKKTVGKKTCNINGRHLAKGPCIHPER